MESSRQIEDAAAVWLQRRDGDDWTPSDQGELEQWLSASLAHRVAFLRLEAAWEESMRLQALGAGMPPGAIPPPGTWHVSPLFEPKRSVRDAAESAAEPPVPTRRKNGRLWAVAASVVVLVAAAFLLNAQFEGQRYRTPVGGIASIPLADGSSVTLNTNSDIRVVLTKEQRSVSLQSGEAFFDVAKDSARPFVVEAGDKRITAIGTQFSVRRDDSDVRVIVTEGKVRIDGAGKPPILVAGAIARTSDASVRLQQGAPRKAEEELSWRTGYLTFDTIELADAVAEFNRYTLRQIVVNDPKVAALRVSGKFRASNAEGFIRVLHDGFGIRTQTVGDKVVLSADD